jgi:hypothetical protein
LSAEPFTLHLWRRLLWVLAPVLIRVLLCWHAGAQEVQSMQFNILVTTYETIMRDRSKLSKLAWKYIIIDEAQRMKDRCGHTLQMQVDSCCCCCCEVCGLSGVMWLHKVVTCCMHNSFASTYDIFSRMLQHYVVLLLVGPAVLSVQGAVGLLPVCVGFCFTSRPCNTSFGVTCRLLRMATVIASFLTSHTYITKACIFLCAAVSPS